MDASVDAASDGGGTDASDDATADAPPQDAGGDAATSLCDNLLTTLGLSCPSVNQGNRTITTNHMLPFGCYRYDEVTIGNGDAGIPITVTAVGDPNHKLPTVILAERFILESVAVLSANLEGWPASSGPGSVGTNGTVAGGAGHGAKGGGSNGGPLYGNQVLPITLGSGGGNASANNGGKGGGAIVLCASQEIVIDGAVRATGEARVNQGASGGGSGGSLLLVAPTVSGVGNLVARGGKSQNALGCNFTGGSGAGGRVAIRATSNAIQPGQVFVAGGVSNNGCLAKQGETAPCTLAACPESRG